MLASWPSMLANYLLVLSLWQSFDCEWVEKVGLLAVKLVVGLVGVSFQLELLSAGTILGPETSKAVQPSWIVLDRDLRDE